MACRTLLRRKTQMNLLEQACARGLAARLALRGVPMDSEAVELAALERDGVLVACVAGRIPEAEVKGRPVEVRFEHEGEHYVFRAVTRGCVSRCLPGTETPPRLKLSLPLRLERARRRQHIRLTARDLPLIEGTFTHVVDGRRQFKARLTDIGDGGIGVTARTAEVSQLYTGDLFWVDMELPGEETRSEFVVRLVHLRPVRNTDQLAMGWVFQPTDDVADYERYVRRLEALVAHRRPPASATG